MCRMKIQFDEDWIFKNEDIEIPYAIKAGRTGMPTDIPDTLQGAWLAIAYDDGPSSKWNFDDWEKVNLPHDWAVYKEYDREAWFMSGYINAGVGCYRKTFRIPAEYEGKKISVDFDGVSRNSTLWINGFLIGNHFSGYTSFSYDISDYLRYGEEGENVIFMKVDAGSPEGWWYEGAGIYRHVYLTVTEKVHVDRYGVFVKTENICEDCADISVETTVFNEEFREISAVLKTTVYDCNGKKTSFALQDICVGPLEKTVVNTSLKVIDPMLWDTEHPVLYRTESVIVTDERECDLVNTDFGIRTVTFTKEGFFLNGKQMILKGTCNHQDFGGVGTALPDSIHEYKILRLKEMGANAYRCAHNPPAPEILEACDRLGMLVMDENRKLDSTPDGIANLESMILRDRNHPSVILWSLNNEEVLLGEKSAKRINQHMREITRKLDPTRMTTVAMNHGWNENTYEECMDIVGYNYGQREDQYFRDAQAYPDRLMLGTETTSSTITRGVYEKVEEKGYLSCYETDVVAHCTTAMKSWCDLLKLPRMTGIFVWTGFDYRGEPCPVEWPCINSHFGIMDMCGLAKDTYYYYQAVWKEEPMIHLFPHWNHKEGEEVLVRVFTNCDSYELVLNGRSLGEYSVEDINLYYDVSVTFEPGTLTAIGKKNGEEVCRKNVVTAGDPAGIVLYPHRNALKNDGEDAIVVHAGIVDSNGIPVPEAFDKITFTVNSGGRILGVCNGDPACHEPDKASERSAFKGWCAAVVQSVKNGERVTLKATALGLKEAEFVFEQTRCE